MRAIDNSVIADSASEARELLADPVRLLDAVEVTSHSVIAIRVPPLIESEYRRIHEGFERWVDEHGFDPPPLFILIPEG